MSSAEADHGPDDKPAKQVKLAAASAVDEDDEDSDWEDLDGMYEFCYNHPSLSFPSVMNPLLILS